MKFVIFGLTVSSSWGNGHATTWRGLLKALRGAGHTITFFERDVPYYAAERDLPSPEFCRLVLYDAWPSILGRARSELAEADVAIVTSYCADGLDASRLVIDRNGPLRAFYDIDTPVTIADLASHGMASATAVHYLTPDLIPGFDLYLSFTGGPVLKEIETRWGARRAAALYCSVDPAIHSPAPALPGPRCALGYLGTYAADRQRAVEQLLMEPARRRPAERFSVAGSMYPADIRWPANVQLHRHVPPAQHAAFYSSSRLTLNVTREAMIRSGYSPSVRLFEAGSCGAAVLSDWWPGLDSFFRPGEEILVAQTPEDVEAGLDLSDVEIKRIAEAARERTLSAHTCAVRARELVAECERARSGAMRATVGA